MHGSITLRNAQRPQLKSGTKHVTYRIVRPNGLSILLAYEAAGRSHAEAGSSGSPAGCARSASVWLTHALSPIKSIPLGRAGWTLHDGTRGWLTQRHTAVRRPVKGGDNGSLLRDEIECDLLSLVHVQGIQKRGRGLRHLLCFRRCIFTLNGFGSRVNRTEVTAKHSNTQHGRNHHNSQQAALLLSLTMRSSDRPRSIICLCRPDHNHWSGHDKSCERDWPARRSAEHTR